MKNTKKFKIYRMLRLEKVLAGVEFSYELNNFYRAARGLSGECNKWAVYDEHNRRIAYMKFKSGKPNRIVLDKKY